VAVVGLMYVLVVSRGRRDPETGWCGKHWQSAAAASECHVNRRRGV